MIRRLGLALAGVLAFCCLSAATTHAATPVAIWGEVVAVCGTPNIVGVAGKPAPYTVDVNGNLCTGSSASSSSLGFRPVSHATPISVTTGGVTGTLPTNTGEVVATNVGTTNAAYCALGASATTSDQYLAPNGGSFGFGISGDTQITCITGTSTTTVNVVGGSGSPSGIGGTPPVTSSVTQGTSPWVMDTTGSGNLDTEIKNPLAAQSNHTTNIGAVDSISQYPGGSTPITISATGTTAATTATLAANASLKTYICGFSIRANANAVATADSTVTGTVTGTLHYTQWTAVNTSGIGLTEQIFSPCIPSSAINTGIAVISAAPGTGGVVSVTAWGYQL